MAGQDIKISATGGGEIDCYLALPTLGTGPGVVIISSVYGVDGDVRDMADRLAGHGFAVAAPDPFWRGDKGPMDRTEDGQRRAAARAKDRKPMIEQGVQDLADAMADLNGRPECNGRIAVIGLCYGGPYAIIGTGRLGCAAGIAFHGTQVQNFLDDIDKVKAPLVLHWGDQDHAAPPEALDKVRAATAGMADVDITIYPGVQHGYTSAVNPAAYDADATENSLAAAIKVIEGLRDSDKLSAAE
jgi:carboxymethylenebutenolidase